jgi:uncharacterized protein YvpB
MKINLGNINNIKSDKKTNNKVTKFDKFVCWGVIGLIVLIFIVTAITQSSSNRKYSNVNGVTTYIGDDTNSNDSDSSNTSSSNDNVLDDGSDTVNDSSTITILPEYYILANAESIMPTSPYSNASEISSLNAALNYIGYDDCTIDILIDDYLIKANPGTATPMQAYIGDPRSNSCYGCFSPVIIDCGNKYLSDQGSEYEIIDKSGTQLRDLLWEIYDDNIVLIWGTKYMSNSYESTRWDINGTQYTWRENEECMILIGFNTTKNIVYVSDPLVGYTAYDIDEFEDRYNQMYSQSVVIRKID